MKASDIDDLIFAIEEKSENQLYERLITRTAQLEAALKDMLLLIEEHGDKVMLAHATRILNARNVLSRPPQTGEK